MSEVIAATVGSLAGAGVEALHGGKRDRARDSRERRRAGADEILRALRPLHRRMRKVQFSRNVKKWVKTIDRALRTIEVHRDLLPDGWHLHRNVRDAVGTATGLGLHELLGGDPRELASFDRLWLERGANYLDYAMYVIERWQSAYKESTANRMQLMDFDPWLREVERRSTIGP
ncbi:hypothetical protein [Microbacterium sp. CH-015]|uniref:hypothetical protein n=1 Tax=Microbacterium sp. CH-015 TaxID=3406734 RepID=UPI003C719ABE